MCVCSFLATEIRCQEKTRGGVCYEVILAQPEVTVPPKRPASPQNKNMSAQDIADKLKAAEERRLVSYTMHIICTRIYHHFIDILHTHVKLYVHAYIYERLCTHIDP